MSESHSPVPWKYLEDGFEDVSGNMDEPMTICDANNEDIAQIYSRDDATALSLVKEESGK